jgi:hypothetical protein
MVRVDVIDGAETGRRVLQLSGHRNTCRLGIPDLKRVKILLLKRENQVSGM